MPGQDIQRRQGQDVAQRKGRETVTFWGAHLLFRNFAGEARQFNAPGDRNFHILLDEQQAKELEAQGWNIKALKPKPDEPQMYHMKVAVSYKMRPPTCYLVSNIDPVTGRPRSKAKIEEDMLEMFDKLESINVDLVVAAYDWRIEATGASGRKAYLQTMMFTLYEDELVQAYADVPDEDELTAAYADVQQTAVLGQVPELSDRPHWDFEGEVVPD